MIYLRMIRFFCFYRMDLIPWIRLTDMPIQVINIVHSIRLEQSKQRIDFSRESRKKLASIIFCVPKFDHIILQKTNWPPFFNKSVSAGYFKNA